jgi:acyl-CoA thioester hydrolase
MLERVCVETNRKHRIIDITFRVRFAETDQMGIVHHAAYLVYLEEGRSELSRQFNAPYSTLEESGYSLAVTEIALRYLAPARYDNLITVRSWIEQLQSRGIVFGYEVILAPNGQSLVTGTTRHLVIDRRGQVRRMPEAWTSAFSSQMYDESLGPQGVKE